MNKEEAIYRLKNTAWLGSDDDREATEKAVDMAIEALQTELNKAVPPSLADVYKWERDIALSQLEEYGICFAEKKRDDLLVVVRCKDCRHWNSETKGCKRNPSVEAWHETDYCNYGERREQ